MRIAGTAMGIILIALISGCAQVPVRYTNYQATQEQFMKDRYECYKETMQIAFMAYVNKDIGAASSQVIPSCTAFHACMAARGYIRSDESGNLEVPPGAEIHCQE